MMSWSSRLMEGRSTQPLIRRAFDYRRRYGWLAAGARTIEWLRVQSRKRKAGLPPDVFKEVNPAPDPARAKKSLKERMEQELCQFLAATDRLVLPAAENPEVSILIVLFNQAAFTYACLQSIIETVDLPAEVVIVDNASSDETGSLLSRLEGARIIRNPENVHFLRGANQAAAAARGRALLFLNNDALLTPGALKAAYESLYRDNETGAVGGKLILPDGTLQEAGSVVWNDGSCAGYARGQPPDMPEVQFRRQVDYCSGAFLLVRRDLFELLQRLDDCFAPAYYEETDLCMRLQEAGWRIAYDPRAEIRHFEFGSSARSDEAVSLMQRNHALFRQRHEPALRRRFPPQTPLLFARSPSNQPRILVIDDRVPFPSQGSGFPRAAHILKCLHAAGFFVTHYPLTEPWAAWDTVRAEHPLDIEFMIGCGPDRFGEFLKARAGYYDFILISRPHNMERFSEERSSNPGAYRGVGIIYDAEAVFALREAQRLALIGRPLRADDAERLVAAEVALAAPAGAVLTVADAEAELFRAGGIGNVHVLGHALTVEQTQAEFAERSDLLFVGALQSDDAPNVDALFWFVREVMPELDALIGEDYRVRVAGEPKAPCLKALRHPRVDLLGRVGDLTREYQRARIFIAPTRFAAGIPFKLHEAAARGLPIVATRLLATQLGWADEAQLLTGDTAERFAAQTARLFGDADLWRRLRQSAAERVGRDCSLTEFDKTLLAVIDSAERRARAAPLLRQSA